MKNYNPGYIKTITQYIFGKCFLNLIRLFDRSKLVNFSSMWFQNKNKYIWSLHV